jgi:DNA repair exonuclease SbcCD ATPase subunit
MLLQICNFRCHKNSTYQFLESGVNLISGDSGVGKTTILKALKWVLFGKIKSVGNNAEAQLDPHYKPKTSVTLSWDKYKIIRSKNPEVIAFVKDGIKWESEVAQYLINDIFGNHKIWDATCNIDQNCLNSLITDSEKDKIELLQNLSFNGESPESILNKIAISLNNCKLEFEKIQVDYNVELKMYNDFSNIHRDRLNDKYNLPHDKLVALKNNIIDLELRIKNYETETVLYNKNLAIAETYEAQKTQLLSKLHNLQFIPLEDKKQELEVLGSTITQFKEFMVSYKLYIEQQQKVEEYQKCILQIPPVTDLNSLRIQLDLSNTALEELRSQIGKFKELEFYYGELRKYKTLLSQCTYHNDLSTLESQIANLKELKECHKLRSVNIELKEKYIAEKNKIILQLSQIPVFDLIQIGSKIDEYKSFLKYESASMANLEYMNSINLLNSKLTECQVPTGIYENLRLSDSQIAELENQTFIYSHNLELATNLGISYNYTIINAEIDRIKSLLNLQPEINKKLNAEALKLQIAGININRVTKEQIHETRKKLQEMKTSNDILQCPHCTNYLKLFNYKLIKSDEKSYSPEEISEYSKYLSNLESDHLLYEKKILLEWELQNLGVINDVDTKKLLNAEEIHSHNIKLLELQRLKIVDAPIYELNAIKNADAYFKIKSKITELTSKLIPGVPQYSSWDTLKSELKNLEDALLNAKNWDTFSINLNLTLAELDNKISTIVIVELPPFDQSQLQILENTLISHKTENEKYKNLQDSITQIEPKSGTAEITKIVENTEAQILELTERSKKLNIEYNLSEKYTNERNFISGELSKLQNIKYNFNQELVHLNITDDKIKEYEQKAEKLKALISSATINNSIWQNYNTELEELNKKLQSIVLDHTLKDKLKHSIGELEVCKINLENHNLHVEYIGKYTSLNNLRNKVLAIQTELTDHYELQKHAIHVERECLESTVSQINNDLYNICSTIFDSDIEVLLALYKPLKGVDKEKECVNIHILNKGIKYDFRELSGGQAARVSLALTIALSLTSNSPIILLDEALTSLDTTAREKCLKIIKHYTRKTVIMVNHLEIEGLYDFVIRI